MNALVGDQWKLSRAEQIRQAMGVEFTAIADALRTQFGAATKISWLRAPPFELGEIIESEPIGERAWHLERKRA